MRKRRRKLDKGRPDALVELDFPELAEQKELKRRRAEIQDAIKVSIRAGIKPPRLLVRYRICLGRLQEWVFKKKLATTKYDRYLRESKRIAKKLNAKE